MELEISIILPCQNEEKALQDCIKTIKKTCKNLSYEIIVSDSSTDSSPLIAKKEKVVLIKNRGDGYGRAYLEALPYAKGKYIMMLDPDGTYNPKQILNFLYALRSGYDFVIGNRFNSKMQKNSMPLLNKYIGNPILSGTLRLFFGKGVKDSHCGMRAISSEALKKLNLKTTGMEFASEMVIKALKNKLIIKEIPIDYRRRKGKSKLSAFKDGWRHLRFMLLYSPLYLFFIPGSVFFLSGGTILISYFIRNINFSQNNFFYYPLFFSSALLISGYQVIIFSFFAKIYAITHFGEKSNLMEKLHKKITLEKSLAIGLVVLIIGFFLYAFIIYNWIKNGFSIMEEIKYSILALTLTVMGIQTIFSAFMLSILGIKDKLVDQ